jgi:hypothetical protein
VAGEGRGWDEWGGRWERGAVAGSEG